MIREHNGRYIYSPTFEKTFDQIKDLLETLESGKWQGKFGLGSIQWTGDRTKLIVDKYIAKAGVDKITREQATDAEAELIDQELTNGGSHESAYKEWSEENASKYSSVAAYNAGYKLCQKYEQPFDLESKAPIRAELAKQIFTAMIG